MSIKRYVSTKDNTISTAFKENLINRATLSNMGASDVLEMFSIFGQASSASLEQARILIEFPVDKISSDRNTGDLPAAGSTNFILKLSNAVHSQTVPKLYTVSASPLYTAWNEGRGLDMESYLDNDTSNWISATDSVDWLNPGGDYVALGHILTSSSPTEFNKFIETQEQDIEIDITSLVEDWLLDYTDNAIHATGAIDFNNTPTEDTKIKLYSSKGIVRTFQFKPEIGGTVDGLTYFVNTGVAGAPVQTTVTNFISQIAAAFSGDMTAAEDPNDDTKVILSQSIPGYYGNTIISASAPDQFTYIPDSFEGGTGAQNHGLVVRLSGSFEDGSSSETYYTKKIFSRSSQYFFKRPCIEARFDASIKDDRNNFIQSSSLANSTENLSAIYLYNKRRSGYADIPDIGDNLVVELTTEVGTPGADLYGPNSAGNHVTASKHSTGIYSAQFAYDGPEGLVYDIWKKDVLTAEIPGAPAVAIINVDGVPVSTESFTVEDTLGATGSFVFVGGQPWSDGSKDEDGNIRIGLSALATLDALIDRIVSVFDAQTDVAITADNNESKLRLTQDITGSSGNTVIDLAGVTNFSNEPPNAGFINGVTFEPAFHTYTNLVTGSGVNVIPDTSSTWYDIPEYSINITNLKSSYRKDEKTSFRLYSRKKNQQPNLYTVATAEAPVDTIRESFYKITRVADDYVVIDYSTGSAPQYSSLSYDSKGSYFDLDMSILEPNYLYEISFLRKEDNDFIEQKERFKFRVDK